MADKIPTYGIYNGPSTYLWKPSNVRDGEMWGQGSEANPVLLPEITVTYNKSKYDSYKQSYKERLKERQRELKRLGLYKGRIDGIWKNKSQAAHEEALKKGYVLDGDKYVYTVVEDTTPYSHVTPYVTVESTSSDVEQPSNNKTTFHKIEAPSSSGTIADRIGQLFPAVRQLLDTYRHYNGIQTNSDFSDSYLENLSQLGQVAYRQYVRNNGYPKEGVKFSLPLTPKVYKEINPSHRYADFKDINGMINAAFGGDRQVEYTDGGMSGTAVVRDGRVYWNPTDEASWTFDPGQEDKLLKDIRKGSIGSALRYVLGNYQRLNDALGTSLKQDLDIHFPADTITVNPARYDNVPKIKQSRFLEKE